MELIVSAAVAIIFALVAASLISGVYGYCASEDALDVKEAYWEGIRSTR